MPPSIRRSSTAEAGHVRRRVLYAYRRVQNFILGTSYMDYKLRRREERVFHTRLSMRTDSQVNFYIIAQETRQKSAIPIGHVKSQPAERTARPPLPYKPLKRPLILFAWVDSCGSTKRPSWGYPVLILGAISSCLSTFGENRPRFLENLSKLTFEYPHEGPCVGATRRPPTPSPT